MTFQTRSHHHVLGYPTTGQWGFISCFTVASDLSYSHKSHAQEKSSAFATLSRTIDGLFVCFEASEETRSNRHTKCSILKSIGREIIKDVTSGTYAVLNWGFTANDKPVIMSISEDDLTCPICCDIFTDPVLLSCSHSFCRSCLNRCWETGLRECSVCRKKPSKAKPPSNLALRNVCQALLEARRSSALDEKMNCNLHGEKLKLFCLEDKQPICLVCQTSKLHKSHDCSPIDEAVQDCKDELALSLKNLQVKEDNLKRIHMTSTYMSMYIKSQALETQRRIKGHFEQLHQVLYQEESARIAAVKKEEEEKIAGIKDMVKEQSAEEQSVTETISAIQEQLEEDEIVLLKNFKAIQDRERSIAPGSENMSGLLIDVAKHLCNLQYNVWEKILDHIDYTPVTLDPNTAHPCLILSDNLTSLRYSNQQSGCPDNAERFHMSAEVAGATSLGSGSHHWVVETGSNQDWLLGAASSSVPRNSEISARPENGFWTLCFRNGEFRAMTSPPTTLSVTRAPEQIKVHLDYDKGTVSFFDPADDMLIYAFSHTFTETLLPYFYTQSSHPLRIMPEKVLVTVLRQ
uniref:zinc-binding protein A33 isoform X2 n=1 Tax=Gasterosteus aculeatus aculeatus TaxID=481459 RepID=UPI001A994498|nr:zinc-binding protein A33 isoform X2 [Gasterosteus aculeatus aculeatus]